MRHLLKETLLMAIVAKIGEYLVERAAEWEYEEIIA